MIVFLWRFPAMARGPGLAHVKLGVQTKGPKGPQGVKENSYLRAKGPKGPKGVQDTKIKKGPRVPKGRKGPKGPKPKY